MKLSDLLHGTPYTSENLSGDMDITGLAIDSRRVSPGFMFVCLKGAASDGHDYIADAAAMGAAAVLCQYVPERAPKGLAYIIVENPRKTLGDVAGNLCGNPQKRLKLIGVTGTKGKTSVTYYLQAILREAGHKTGVIGTTGAFAGDMPIDIPYQTASTPDTIELYHILAEMAGAGMEYVVMEATSHGLVQHRTRGLEFQAGVFTNLSHEHLDYHLDMERYAAAKGLLFRQSRAAIINNDDPWGKAVLGDFPGKTVLYGINNAEAPGIYAENVELLPEGVRFDVTLQGKAFHMELASPGRFSVYNGLAALAAAYEMGVSPEAIREGLKHAQGVPGRCQRIENDKGLCVIVDYAHTPDSLRSIIEAVREFTRGRVITAFGCGGDRDREKRPIMGEIAGRLSDFCVVTSDNPRNENPLDIITAILPGVKQAEGAFHVEPDRAAAIAFAINAAKPGDSVIIAGKGHEAYQEFENRRREHFDDRETVRKALDTL